MTSATPMQALAQVVGLACRSSASCWGIHRRQRRSDMHILMPILCVVHRRQLAAGSPPRSTGGAPRRGAVERRSSPLRIVNVGGPAVWPMRLSSESSLLLMGGLLAPWRFWCAAPRIPIGDLGNVLCLARWGFHLLL